MGSYTIEARRYAQQNYGGYCNKVRQAGLEPIPYTNFVTSLNDKHKSTWVEYTKWWHEERGKYHA